MQSVQAQNHIVHSMNENKWLLKVYCFFNLYNRSAETIIRQARRDHLPDFDVTSEDSTTCIQVRRKHIWKDTLRAIKQPGFTTRKWLKIEFVGESAIDDGGPRREYFRLGMHELRQNSALFQGALDKRIPVHNLHLLNNKEYREVGRFFAMSILQGGPAPQFLSPTIAHYLLYGDEGLQPEISDIPDCEVRAKVQKVHACTIEHQAYRYIATKISCTWMSTQLVIEELRTKLS